jgi:hypothetical protein
MYFLDEVTKKKKRTVKGNIKGRYISLLFMLYSSRTWMIVSESRMYGSGGRRV